MPIHPLNLLTIPLALTLIALFAAAAVYDFITFRRRRKSATPVVYRCDACRHIYTVPHRTPLARCPKCGSQNEPVRE
jgi:rRNA maturation endonuclease Nob1